jgi:hypothetical protein
MVPALPWKLSIARGIATFLSLMSRNVSTQFTFDSGRDASPVWVDKGSRIVWQGPNRLYVKPSNGAGREEVLHPEPWIPDKR